MHFCSNILIFAADFNLRGGNGRNRSLFLFVIYLVLGVIEQHITTLLNEKFKEEDFQDCFLVDLNFNQGNKKVEVFVDSDSGISFQTCQKLSRYLEGHIDEKGWLGEKYVLEVSSPGIGRPLKFQRQYPKNIGRKVEVKTTEGEKHTGTLVSVTEDAITLEDKVRIKEGKRKKTVLQKQEISFDQISETKVKISFNRS